MQAKAILGLVLGALPVIYFGGLIYYFMGVGGSVEGAVGLGLQPTILGLGVIGLIFAIPLIIKFVRLFSGDGGRGDGPAAPPRKDKDDDEGGIDPDAAIARYLARRTAEAATASPASAAPAKPSGFGQRSR